MNKLLIFDVDGVLGKEDIIYRKRFEAQFRKIAEKLGISMEEAEKEYYESKKKLPPEKRTTSADTFTQFGFTREEYFEVIDSVDPEGITEPHDHCEEVIKKLSKDNVIVTLSNTPRKTSVKTLKLLKIDKYIKKAYCADSFKESKPSTIILEKIMEEQGFKAEDTFMIGNAPKKDTAPAYKIGIKAILFDPKGEFPDVKDVDYVIKDLVEIVELI